MTDATGEFIAGLGAAAWPLAARAQQRPLPVVGFLNAASAWEYAPLVEAFRQGLSETGFVEGRNVLVEYYWAEGHYERLPILAADLVRREVAVIVANTPAAAAAKALTTTIPIVFQTAGDPVALGFVASLARPGGNLTGTSALGVEITPKRLELLHQAVPTASVIGALLNPANPAADAELKTLQTTAGVLGLKLHVLHASTERDIDAAFASLAQLGAGGLVINDDPFLLSRIELVAALSLRHKMPTMFENREFVAAGGLMSYGRSAANNYRIIGAYTGRILKGEKPADLPVQHETRIELFLNTKTAGALGLTIPETLLATADEVIQ